MNANKRNREAISICVHWRSFAAGIFGHLRRSPAPIRLVWAYSFIQLNTESERGRGKEPRNRGLSSHGTRQVDSL